MMKHGHATAIPIEHDMWVMPTWEFLQLSELQPHEELLAAGKLVRADDAMRRIFYVSHEWTSSEHPDHSTSQLRSFQAILLRMLHGTCPETSPAFNDAVRLPPGVKITSGEWQTLVRDSFVWLDFISVRRDRRVVASAGLSACRPLFLPLLTPALPFCTRHRCLNLRWPALQVTRVDFRRAMMPMNGQPGRSLPMLRNPAISSLFVRPFNSKTTMMTHATTAAGF